MSKLAQVEYYFNAGSKLADLAPMKGRASERGATWSFICRLQPSIETSVVDSSVCTVVTGRTMRFPGEGVIKRCRWDGRVARIPSGPSGGLRWFTVGPVCETKKKRKEKTKIARGATKVTQLFFLIFPPFLTLGSTTHGRDHSRAKQKTVTWVWGSRDCALNERSR